LIQKQVLFWTICAQNNNFLIKVNEILLRELNVLTLIKDMKEKLWVEFSSYDSLTTIMFIETKLNCKQKPYDLKFPKGFHELIGNWSEVQSIV
jgi:hypothetical protein